MNLMPVSVIVVSRHRPQALRRCIAALRQQDHPQIELVVVADPSGIAALREGEGAGGAADLVCLPFDQANIAQARNIGLQAAAGEVVLFIDDDAVAEPTWASRLAAPFDHAGVVAATGFVRGRNGISYQWRAGLVDHQGQDHPLEVPAAPSLHSGSAKLAVKTQGTNCAFRAASLRAIGGFDPAFAYFLDEADVNLRLASLGQTAVVPDAQVHHGYMASAQRRANRAPTSLFDIAASTAVFLRKHAADPDLAAAYQRLYAQQRRRLRQFQRQLRLPLGAAGRLMASLAAGWQDGLQRPFGQHDLPQQARVPFRALAGTGPRPGCVIAGYAWQAAELLARASAARDAGLIVTVFCLALSLRRHRMQFLPQGIWWQSGGIWGRSARDQSALIAQGLRARVAQENHRVQPYRPV